MAKVTEESLNKKRIGIEKARKDFCDRGLILLEKEYINVNTPMKCKNKDNYLFSISYSSVKDKRTKQVAKTLWHKRNPYSCHNIKQWFIDNDIELELLSDIYNDEKTPLLLKCKCGRKYYATINHLQQGNDRRCDKCRKQQSNIAYLTEKFLQSLGIKYEKEKRFNDCRNKKPLPFDFYLTDYNSCIEVNGCQHYYEYTSDKFFKSRNFEERCKCDNIKIEYCMNKNIPLLTIPFWHIQNNGKEKELYKKEIIQFLNNIK